MPTTIEELEGLIEDTIAQANSILFLNHNILEEYESRRKKVNPTLCFLVLISFFCILLHLFIVSPQVEELSRKQEIDEKEFSAKLDEINALKVREIWWLSYS